MQNITKPASAPQSATWLTTYGPFILSVLAILVIAVAWFLHNIDQTAALTFIGVILGGNGIVSATQWQAAPGVIASLQQLIGALLGHIQALHQAQLQTMQSQPAPAVDQAVTAKVAALPVAPTPASAPASPDQSLLVPRQQLFSGQQPRPTPGG